MIAKSPSVVLISGLPGCGKTTLAQQLARRLQFPLFAKDRIQRVLNDQVSGATSIAGYYVLMDLADEQLGLGLGVVLDAVFPQEGFRDRVRQMASTHMAYFRPIICHCSNRELWQARIEHRLQLVPGWPPAQWDEVERVQAIFEPWSYPDVLALDAANPLEENVKRALDFINAIASD